MCAIVSIDDKLAIPAEDHRNGFSGFSRIYQTRNLIEQLGGIYVKSNQFRFSASASISRISVTLLRWLLEPPRNVAPMRAFPISEIALTEPHFLPVFHGVFLGRAPLAKRLLKQITPRGFSVIGKLFDKAGQLLIAHGPDAVGVGQNSSWFVLRAPRNSGRCTGVIAVIFASNANRFHAFSFLSGGHPRPSSIVRTDP